MYYISEKQKKNSAILGEIFQLNIEQSLIIDARTSQNEVFNSKN